MGRKVVGSRQSAHIMEVAGPFRGVSLRNDLLLLVRNGTRAYAFPFRTFA